MTRPRRTPVLLGLCVLALSACGGGSPGSGSGDQQGRAVAAQGPPTAQTVHLDGTSKLAFDPSTVTAKVGTLTIELGIKGGTPHDLEFSGTDRAKIPLVTGAPLKATYTFQKAGTYTFVCTIHQGMSGQVVVS